MLLLIVYHAPHIWHFGAPVALSNGCVDVKHGVDTSIERLRFRITAAFLNRMCFKSRV